MNLQPFFFLGYFLRNSSYDTADYTIRYNLKTRQFARFLLVFYLFEYVKGFTT